MPSKVKIYTKTGDKSETSLFGGKRIPKSHLRIETYGAIDELNSLLGIVISKLADKRAEEFINQVQKDLFLIGSYLAGSKVNISGLSWRVKNFEEVIDSLDSELPELKNFILPEGTERATYLFYARAIVRRVERELVSLSQSEEVDSKVLVYFNRLSDFLFILARYLNFKSGFIESVWRSK